VKLYRTTNGAYVEHDGTYFRVPEAWDALIAHHDLHGTFNPWLGARSPRADFDSARIEAPIGSQEVWAAGVTYYRSRSARMEEAKDAGGGDFYDRVYSSGTSGAFLQVHGQPRRRSGQPRCGFAATQVERSGAGADTAHQPRGQIIGYTVGNDMSSRDIEGENPLYLPQAKVYDRSCALGPCVLVSKRAAPRNHAHRVEIERAGEWEFSGATTLAN
jgi:2-dehydro-3-deoxy-D-arabinonate dehydratase